jgi:hypothetical protein
MNSQPALGWELAGGFPCRLSRGLRLRMALEVGEMPAAKRPLTRLSVAPSAIDCTRRDQQGRIPAENEVNPGASSRDVCFLTPLADSSLCGCLGNSPFVPAIRQRLDTAAAFAEQNRDFG